MHFLCRCCRFLIFHYSISQYLLIFKCWVMLSLKLSMYYYQQFSDLLKKKPKTDWAGWSSCQNQNESFTLHCLLKMWSVKYRPIICDIVCSLELCHGIWWQEHCIFTYNSIILHFWWSRWFTLAVWSIVLEAWQKIFLFEFPPKRIVKNERVCDHEINLDALKKAWITAETDNLWYTFCSWLDVMTTYLLFRGDVTTYAFCCACISCLILTAASLKKSNLLHD